MPSLKTRRYIFSTLIILSNTLLWTQNISLYSILQSRQAGGDIGYTLDGKFMNNSSRLKLLNGENFGPNGKYPKTVSITDAFGTTGSLTFATKLPREALFFFGSFNKAEPTLEVFTGAEIDSLYNWSLRGGKLIITAGLDFVSTNYFTSILNQKWNFKTASETGPVISGKASTTGLETELFNGPFGQPGGVLQGGLARGYYLSLPSDVKVMAATPTGNPVVYLDCKTLDLLVIDVDIYTQISYVPFHDTLDNGIGPGNKITTSNDKFLANTIAFMDKLQGPPVIIKNGNQLSVGANYRSYQWYKNNEPVTGANFPEFSVPSENDNYYVEVEVNGGCKVRSSFYDPTCDFLFVPTAFSPNNNDINEKACYYGSCLDDIDFKIFDRWGELIFRSSEAEKCWDGTYKGVNAPSGTYSWSIDAGKKSGGKITKKGSITLIR